MSIRPQIELVLGPVMKRMPRVMWQIRYLKHFHELLNWNNPQTIYAYMARQAVDNRANPDWAVMADKYKARDFVADRIGPQYLVKSYGVWENANDIDFDALPDQFVLKTNNATATNMFVRDKSRLDVEAARRTLNRWLKLSYGALTGELHYKMIHPVIIAEEMLNDGSPEGSSPNDYKFYCFNGEPRYMMLCAGRKVNTHQYDLMIYDMDWNEHAELVDPDYPRQIRDYPRPSKFDLMRELAAKLSQGLKFVRVDFYLVGDQVKFGEITLTPGLDYSSPLTQKRFLEELAR